jgi:16S rRNA A1518/A1519 N6-dimethyltransferase RsmA/KsgA/DIM1 with predicted DNA glycosylase/AP lyase activity
MEKNIAREQHVLVNVVHHRELLATLNLSGRHVLEFGVGTGALTKLVLERDPEAVIGYEIDPSLCQLRDSRLTLHEGDLTQAHFSYLAGAGKYCIIANPRMNVLDTGENWSRNESNYPCRIPASAQAD